MALRSPGRVVLTVVLVSALGLWSPSGVRFIATQIILACDKDPCKALRDALERKQAAYERSVAAYNEAQREYLICVGLTAVAQAAYDVAWWDLREAEALLATTAAALAAATALMKKFPGLARYLIAAAGALAAHKRAQENYIAAVVAEMLAREALEMAKAEEQYAKDQRDSRKHEMEDAKAARDAAQLALENCERLQGIPGT